MFKYIAVLVIAICAISARSQAQPGSGPPGYGWFPFVLPAFDDSPTVTDVSWLNEKPAGKHGFIRTEGEHFVDGNGKSIRFWGANISFEGAFPRKEEAPRIAARLAKYGFNAIRIHSYEGYAAPRGLWKPHATGSSRVKIPREIDENQLDKLDYFVSKLIENGIYVDLNLHVGRKTVVGEGVEDAHKMPDKDKGVDYYNEQLIQLQKDFARQMLQHTNPYTNRTYAAEPGVCAVEITNEDSIISMWLDDALLNKLPDSAATELSTMWNDWLKRHYKDDASLAAAWTEASEPLGAIDVLSQPYPSNILNPRAPDARFAIGMNTLKQFGLREDQRNYGTTRVDALGAVIDGATRPGLTVTLRNNNATPWGYQLDRDGLNLYEGQVYTLTFWARSDKPRRASINLWQDRMPFRFAGFSGYANLKPEWQRYSFVFRPVDVDPNHSRLSFNLGKEAGTVQISEATLYSGGQLTVPRSWTLENGVPLIDARTTQIWRTRRDFAAFLGEIEQKYAQDMRQYVREELNVKSPIWVSQAQFGALGGILRESDSDAIDVHAYWKHPSYSQGDWQGSSWTVGNESMIPTAANSPLPAYAQLRLAGKPFVMSEWNSGQPSNFGAETLPMIAAYAAWQDWAGIYLFDYHSSGNYSRSYIEGYFSMDSNPAKMATAPAAALLYRRGDVNTAQEHITLTVPQKDVWFNVANSAGPPAATPFQRLWKSAGADDASALQNGMRLQISDNAAFPLVSKSAATSPHKSTFVSDTQEIRWNKIPPQFTANGATSKLIAGYSGTQGLDLGTLHVAASLGQYSVIMLSSIDGKPVPSSQRMVLTAIGDAQNQGTQWTAAKNSVTNWGKSPTHARGVNAKIDIVTNHSNMEVWSLDVTGKRRSKLSSKYNNGVLTFQINPSFQAVWYEISSGV